MHHRFWSVLAAIALVGLTALWAAAVAPLKVAFVYVGPISDVIRQLAAKGYDVIFATSFGYMEPTLKVAKLFPKARFKHATGFKAAANVVTYQPRFYEGAYLLGVLAGRMSKTNTLGYIGSFPIPEVIRNIDAFTLGEKGLYAFGWDSDMGRYGQHAQLTANTENWGVYYIDEINKVLDGSWTGNRQAYLGIKDGVIVLTPLNPVVPAEVAPQFESKKQAIIAGSLVPFAGPIKDNSGVLKVAAGASVSIDDLMAINWYVEGVDGKVPQ
ncbi:MAG: BMP family ABC transporter substrate-binding protein [Steroidobacterales bacterium]